MSTQLKKGFTLIELMVVIVIIGILAAIAIPKLFGMSAKAKASEVGPAVGTWAKLQLAFVMEKEELGSFKEIAYKAPGDGGKTATFDYTGKEGDSVKGQWEAKLVPAKLTDDCKDGATWEASFATIDNEEPSTVKNGCPELTPNFCNIRSDRTCN